MERCERNIHGVQNGVRQKEYKIFIISPSDAIINPWAMMVHFQNTPKVEES